MKHLLFVIGMFAITLSSFSQDVVEAGKKAKNFVSSEYNRNSITLVGLDFGENLSSQVYSQFKNLAVPDKFYDNPLNEKVLVTGVARTDVSDMLNQLDETEIAKWLNKNKVGQQILATWFNRQADGSFDVDVLKDRGMFNADDNEFMIASASKRGESSLMDMGLQLVNQSYLIAFDFNNILTMNQYYDKNEVETEKRTMNGYKANLKSFLFKLDFNETVAAEFFQDYWIGENTPDKKARKEAFENAEFPFVFLSKQNNDITSAQYNPGQSLAPKVQKSSEELVTQMLSTALENTLTDIENQNADFRVKAMVSDVRPIAAKIGKKEGLKFDQRYFVLENRARRNGSLYSKRVGVVKSMKVVDNRKVTSGQSQSSEFYQIAGGAVDNYGMFLEQNNDVGLNIFLGTTVGGLSGFTGRAEYYISKFFGEFVGEGKSGRLLTSWKIYAEGGYGMDDDQGAFTGTVEDFTFMRASFGVSKDFYPFTFVHWGPFIGYGIESGSWEITDEKISTDFIEMGLRVGVNLAHNIQFIGSTNYYMMLTSEIMDENDEVSNDDFEYEEYFENRMGPGVSLGLRIMF